MREAFLAEYLRQRLSASTERQTCQLAKAPAAAKNFTLEDVPYYAVNLPKGRESCEASFSRPGMTMVR